LVVEVINDILSSKANRQKQNESDVILTQYMKKSDGFFDIAHPPTKDKLNKMIRAYYPWPGVWTKFEIRNSKFEILKLLPEQKLQVEGGKPMSIKDFLNGYPKLRPQLEQLLEL